MCVIFNTQLLAVFISIITYVAGQSCTRPKKFSNGNIILFDIRNSLQSDLSEDSIQEFASVNIECDEGFRPYPNYDRVTCHAGKWDREFPRCLEHCPPLISASIDFSCTHRGKSVDCSKHVPRCTNAQMKCKKLYELYDETDVNSTEIRCVRGVWKGDTIQCLPICGKSYSEGTAQTFVIGGRTSRQGDYPWHVGIFHNISGDITHQCGGTLISPNIVLSAAHCFTDDISYATLPLNMFRIAAGKHYRNFTDNRDTNGQIRSVKNIIIAEGYRGGVFNLYLDFGLAILEEPFVINTYVQIICLDWHGRFEEEQSAPGTLGKVVGWGLTQTHSNPSDELQELTLPLRDRQTCFNETPADFHRFIMPDKFCGGFRNGSTICNGDSGGGIIFYRKESRKFYLRGVVSNGPRRDGGCDPNQYSVYTNVSHYMELISDTEVEFRLAF